MYFVGPAQFVMEVSVSVLWALCCRHSPFLQLVVKIGRKVVSFPRMVALSATRSLKSINLISLLSLLSTSAKGIFVMLYLMSNAAKVLWFDGDWSQHIPPSHSWNQPQ